MENLQQIRIKMNFNTLDFLEIGLTVEPNFNICTKIKDDFYGFVVENNFDYLDSLACHKTINKIYYNSSIPLIDIFDIYNIIEIKYLKINCNDLNYAIISSLINSNKAISIEKIQFESKIKDNLYQQIINILSNNYIYLDGGEHAFFIHKTKIINLICTPNILDEIFINNIKSSLELSSKNIYN